MRDNSNKQIKRFMGGLMIFSFALFVAFYDCYLGNYNSTLYAFSYKYGFISRALIGTIYNGINNILPVDMISYPMAMRFTEAITLLFLMLLFAFAYFILKRVKEENLRITEVVILSFFMYAVSNFAGNWNFGRVDLYMLSIGFIAAMLVVKDKAVWLLIPLGALGVMFHEGYVFMYANILLVLLLYKTLDARCEDKIINKKYGIIFLLTFLAVAGLFVWFMFFSHANGEAIYDEVVRNATALCDKGDYHEDLVKAEILGVNLGDVEAYLRVYNKKEFAVYIVSMLPLIMVGIMFFVETIKAAKEPVDKIKYLAVALGSLTIMPDMLLKIDYGRWIFAVYSYYFVVLMALFAMGDEIVLSAAKNAYMKLKKHTWFIGFVAYSVMFLPFQDIVINDLVDQVCILIRRL